MAKSSTCAECGAQMNFADSFRLTISSPGHDMLEAAFCRQDHAAHWLSKPMPVATPDAPLTRSDGLIFLVLLAIFVLAVVGVIALATGFDVNPF